MLKGMRFIQQGRAIRLAPPTGATALMTRSSQVPGASMVKGFTDFIKNGNIVDLAVAVVIGTAFAALITQFTDSFLTPLIGATTGGGDVGGQFTFNGQNFTYGAFIGSIVTFLNTAAVVYFFVVLPMNKLLRRSAKPALEETAVPVCPTDTELLAEIRDLLRAQQERTAPPV
jgi:large conductance mechanosensitive channel